MLKHQQPVTIAVPAATREVLNQLAKATGKPQHEVVAEAAELLLKRERRRHNQNLK